MPPPSTILFDVGGTVLKELRFDLEAGIRAVLPEFGDQVGHIAKCWRGVVESSHAVQRDLLLASWLIEHVTELRGSTVGQVEDAMWPAVVALVPTAGIADILRLLNGAGVRIAAVSNASFSGRVLEGELHRHGLGEYFEFVLSSGDLGMRKPATAIFHEALARMGTPPERAWFVGDTFDEDIVGAAEAGLTTFWFVPDGPDAHVDAPAFRIRRWTDLWDHYQTTRLATDASAH